MIPLPVVVLAPLVASLVPSAFPAGTPRRILRVSLALGAALLPLALIGRADGLSLSFSALVSILAFLAVTFSTGRGFFVRISGDIVGDPDGAPTWSRVSVYFALLGAFWSAMLLVVLATTFTVVWLGISATTLASAFLVAFGGEAAALEAAWKYLILCSMGIAFALIGMLLLAHVMLAAGLAPTAALAWTAIHHDAPAAPPLARVAIALMLIGFATKAGLVPMHAWLPDAHSKAPAPISGLLSGVLVSCALYALMRTLEVANALGCGPFAREILMWLGVLSTVVAGVLMLVQSDLKRLLAYSTVEHAGIVALALGFGGPIGTIAALVHVFAHGFAKAAAFFAVGLVQRQTRTTSLRSLYGLWRAGGPGRMLVAAFVALAGLPPFGLFVSELLVVVAGVAAGRWVPLGLGLAGIVMGFAALARTCIDLAGGESAHHRPLATAGLVGVSTGAAVVGLTGAFGTFALPWTGVATFLRDVAAGAGLGP